MCTTNIEAIVLQLFGDTAYLYYCVYFYALNARAINKIFLTENRCISSCNTGNNV